MWKRYINFLVEVGSLWYNKHKISRQKQLMNRRSCANKLVLVQSSNLISANSLLISRQNISRYERELEDIPSQ